MSDQRKRHLAFTEVGAHRLAQGDSVPRKVEQVIDQLECHAQIEPVLLQRRFLISADPAKHATNLRAAAEEIGGLAADDLQVLLFGDIRVTVLAGAETRLQSSGASRSTAVARR